MSQGGYSELFDAGKLGPAWWTAKMGEVPSGARQSSWRVHVGVLFAPEKYKGEFIYVEREDLYLFSI